MTDLVAELRKSARLSNIDAFDRAADEIERLTAERDKLLKATSPIHAHVDMLRAERDRLRAALEKYGSHVPGCALLWGHVVAEDGGCTCGFSEALAGTSPVDSQTCAEVNRLRAALEGMLNAVSRYDNTPAVEAAREALAGTSDSQQAADIRDSKA